MSNHVSSRVDGYRDMSHSDNSIAAQTRLVQAQRGADLCNPRLTHDYEASSLTVCLKQCFTPIVDACFAASQLSNRPTVAKSHEVLAF